MQKLIMRVAGDKDDRRSTSGYIIYFQGCPVGWKTKKQPVVSLSTTEAELYPLSSAMQELLWTKYFLNEMGYTFTTGLLYEDNMGCVNLVNQPRKETRTKHIYVKMNFINENIQAQEMTVKQKEADK